MTTSAVPALLPAVAATLATALPLPAPATAGEPTPAGRPPAEIFGLLPPGAGTVVVADLEPSGLLAVVIGSALTQALSDSPMGELDVAAAIQPALDAAASASGLSAGQARSTDLDSAVEELFSHPDAWLIPLNDPDGWVCATIVVVAPSEAGQFTDASSEPEVVAEAVVEPVPGAVIPRQTAARSAGGAIASGAGLDLLRDVVMEVTVELGRTRMTISELLSLAAGAVVELDRAAGSPADLLVNGTLLARGEVVVVDEDFGIRITEIVGPMTDVNRT
ncbi:MAG TPA: flagellar motor switch protein FliN [Sporichthya sp.]|nr:flagellar motor switch protein FliN [Sporichthya sp.]